MTSPPNETSSLTVDDFDYRLPEALIAQTPAARRERARLLVVGREDGGLADRHVSDLPELVRGDELIVVNDTRVVPARLMGRKPTGGRVELLVVEPDPADPQVVLAMGRSSKPLRRGTPVVLPGGERLEVLDAHGAGLYRVRLPDDAGDPWEFLEARGEVPLPPYIHRGEAGPGAADAERYQTVYARHPGSVAAPTAGLHFTDGLLDRLRAAGCELAHITLHVGPGTFLPVRVERLADHRMHHERFEISDATAAAVSRARADRRPVMAVGTTVVRTLEAVAAAHGGAVVPGAGATDLFVTPGFPLQVVDRLMTNFHLPRSTLLMLVAAFAGRGHVLAAYAHAVARGYRFFSYGDAMWIR